ncbi:MAG: hypothetical protein JRJ29_14205 [Deltaproteobacteria bacterium]|nr:hypothetical protein [Deltaproteobacteria bacterium]
MRVIRTLTVGAALCLLCVGLTNTASAKELIVVASKATYEASQKWVDFLTLHEVPLKHITPQEFNKYKKSPFIVLMGGIDEPDGIMALAKEVLSEDEFRYIAQKGNGEMYLKFKVWDPMQTVIVFAGSDGAAAEAARKKNRKVWWDTFISWFDLDAEMGDQFHEY